MALPVPGEFIDRGSYWYHRPTGSTTNPVFGFRPVPNCIIIDEDITSLQYVRGREGLNANYSEDCIRKTGVTYSASATILEAPLGLPIVSQIDIADMLNMYGAPMQQIGPNSFRHCATGSTISLSYGCDFTVDQDPCNSADPCNRAPIGIIGLSLQRVTAFQTPAGNCIKVPIQSLSMSARIRKDVYNITISMNQVRNFMQAITTIGGGGVQPTALASLLHNADLWSTYGEIIGNTITSCT